MGKPTIWFPTRSNTNLPVPSQKMARSLKFWSYVEEEVYYPRFRVAKTKALISFTVTGKLICAFVFAYADCWFSHAVALIIVIHQKNEPHQKKSDLQGFTWFHTNWPV